jgi:hypothetical protein
MRRIDMKYPLVQAEIDNVLRQTNEVRYDYFVKRVADWGEVWSLKGADGWVLSGDSTGNIEVAMFWPFMEYAKLCIKDEWSETIPTKIKLAAFLDRWLPGFKKDGRLVGVFPNLAGQAAVIDPLVLKRHLEDEMKGFWFTKG